jgi:urea transport system substrate-binding protein
VQRFALPGTDHVYPRTTNNILEAYLIPTGIPKEDIFVNYTPFGDSDWSNFVSDVVAPGADGKKVSVISTINGDVNFGFHQELAAAGVSVESLPVVAFSVGEEELSGLDTSNLVGRLAAWKAFIRDDKRVSIDPMEAHSIGFSIWVNAVAAAGTTEVDAVSAAMIRQEFPNLTGGTAKMLHNHHLTKPVPIGEARADGQSTSPARPNRSPAMPGPTTSRTRRCWRPTGPS